MLEKVEISQSKLQSFQVLRENDDFYDVTLVTDDEERVEAHKAVLSAFSPFFKNIFESCNLNQQPFVYLGDIKSSQIHGVLDYIYKGTVHISPDEVESFLKVARKLKISELCNIEVMREPLEEPHNDTLRNSNDVKSDLERNYEEANVLIGIQPLGPTPPPIPNFKMEIQKEKRTKKFYDYDDKMRFMDISNLKDPPPESDRNRPPVKIYEKPKAFSFVEGGEEYVLSREAIAYYSQHYKCNPNYFNRKFTGLKRRSLTTKEKRKIISMGFGEKVTPSSCFVFLKKEFDDILEGRNVDNYTKPISLQLPAGKIFS